MVKAYLSIDLDYFQQQFPAELFDRIAMLPVSKIVVESHEELLPHINKHVDKFDVLYNVDYHSDLASMDKSKAGGCDFGCDEGTWGNFVKGSLSKTFVWVPPSKGCLSTSTGYCHGKYVNPFRTKKPEISCWAATKIEIGKIPLLDDCIAIGIAVSTMWSKYPVIEAFYQWYQQHKQMITMNRTAQRCFRWYL